MSMAAPAAKSPRNNPEGRSSARPGRLASSPRRLGPFVAAYALAVALDDRFFLSNPDRYVVLYSSGGVLLGALFVTAKRDWSVLLSAVTLVRFLIDGAFGISPGVSALAASFSVIEGVCGTLLMREGFGVGRADYDLRKALAIVTLSAGLSLSLTAALAAVLFATPAGSGFREFANWPFLQTRWMGLALGIVAVTPPTLVWWRGHVRGYRPDPTRAGPARPGLFVGGVAALAWLVFEIDPVPVNPAVLPFVLLPVVVWALLLRDARAVTGALLAIALVSASQTQRGRGPFHDPGGSLYEAVVSNQLFLAMMSLSVLILGAFFVEREKALLGLRRANVLLRELSARTIQAQEDERRAVARELHDRVGQDLTALKIDLHLLRGVDGVPDAVRDRVGEAEAFVGRVLGDVREISLSLRPSVLDDLGLEAALRWYLDRQGARAGFEGRVAVVPDGFRLDPSLETTCYRIVQEAVTNIIRHAGARRVDVVLTSVGRGSRLEVRDDGRGFDPADALGRAASGESLGLLGLRERVELVGGWVEVHSGPGDGARIAATFPGPIEDDR